MKWKGFKRLGQRRTRLLRKGGDLWPFILITASSAPQSRFYFLILKQKWMSLTPSRSSWTDSLWMRNDTLCFLFYYFLLALLDNVFVVPCDFFVMITYLCRF